MVRKINRKCSLQYCHGMQEHKTIQEVLDCEFLRDGVCYQNNEAVSHNECSALIAFRNHYIELKEALEKPKIDLGLPQNRDEVGGYSGLPSLSMTPDESLE